MDSDEKILEYSPILYTRNRRNLYLALLRRNYSKKQIDRLFGELYKYNLEYFYCVPVKEKLNELNKIPVKKKEKGFILTDLNSLSEFEDKDGLAIPQNTKIIKTDRVGLGLNDIKSEVMSSIDCINTQDNPNTDQVTLLDNPNTNQFTVLDDNLNTNRVIVLDREEIEYCVKNEYVRDCFDTYHMRDRRNIYDITRTGEDGDFDRHFLCAYRAYLQGEYVSAREEAEALLRKSSTRGSVHFGCRLHVLSIATAASYKSGGYYNAVWLARAGKTLSENVKFVEGVEYFESMLLVIEAAREMSGVRDLYPYTLLSDGIDSRLSIPITLEDKINRCIQYRNEITLLRDVKIYDSREVYSMEMVDITIGGYIEKIKEIGDKCESISPIVVYSIDGCIAFGLIYYNEKTKISVIKSKISVETILDRFAKIHTKNKEILKRTCTTEEEIREWWRDRSILDRKIEREIVNIDTYLQKYIGKGHQIKRRVGLVIEDILGSIPFEMCNTFAGCGVFRSSSLSQILLCKNSPVCYIPTDRDFFYVLNPEKNLVRTEKRILEYIQRNIPDAEGIRNRVPLPMEAEQAILSHRIFMYFGHGGGEKFFAPRNLRKITKDNTEARTKSIFLFGCSSAKISGFTMYNTHSTCISYMHIPVVKNVVGALWDITDKDLDITSIGIMDAIRKGQEPISMALNRLKRECKLKYLNGAALVLYGIDE